MKSLETFENEIRNEIKNEADKVTPREDMYLKIERRIKNKNMEDNNMKIKNSKRMRVILIACVALMLTTATGFAVTQYVVYKNMPSKEMVIEETGFCPSYVEKFANGYEYTTGGVEKSSNPVGGGDMVDIRYLNGDSVVHYHAMEVNKDSDCLVGIESNNSQTVENIMLPDDTKALFITEKVKLIPFDYEKTEQDIKDEENGTYWFMFSIDKEVKIVDGYTIMWQDGNILYNLSTYDGTLDKQQFTDMAKEIVEK